MLKYSYRYYDELYHGVIENDQLNTGDFSPHAIIAAEETDEFFRVQADGVHLTKIHAILMSSRGRVTMFNSEDSRTIVMNWKNLDH